MGNTTYTASGGPLSTLAGETRMTPTKEFFKPERHLSVNTIVCEGVMSDKTYPAMTANITLKVLCKHSDEELFVFFI